MKNPLGKLADKIITHNTTPEEPTNFSSGVFYFNVTATRFGVSLATFITKHPELKICGIASGTTDGYGVTRGYWVICETKEIAQ